MVYLLPDVSSDIHSARLCPCITSIPFSSSSSRKRRLSHWRYAHSLGEGNQELTLSQIISDMKSYAKPVNKYPPKKPNTKEDDKSPFSGPTIQSKLVLLTLTFPRVRIIWSSSPYATAEIFKDLKKDRKKKKGKRKFFLEFDLCNIGNVIQSYSF